MKRYDYPMEGMAAGSSRPASLRVMLEPLVMVGIWGANFSVVKAALAEVPPLAFNTFRFLLASLLFYAVMRVRGPIPLPRRADRARIVGLGILGNVAYQLCFIYGVNGLRAGVSSLLLAGTPILTALLSAARGQERPGVKVWAGAIATVLGMALVVEGLGEGIAQGEESLAGALLMVGASAAWSVYTVGSRDLIARYGPGAVTAWTLWVGAIGLFLLGLREVLVHEWVGTSVQAWIGIVYSGALAISVAYLLWSRAVQAIGSARAAIYNNLVPVLALVVAWLWLGEVPTGGQAIGAGIIIAGVSLAQRRD